MDITLRRWLTDDLEDLVSIANNRNIEQYMADVFPHPYTRANGTTFIEFATTSCTANIYAITINDQPVGSIGLHLQTDILRKNAEIGYWLAEQHWGKGIMVNAIKQIITLGFNDMDIVRIFARIYGNNIPSQKVIQKAGFNLEAKFKKTIFKNNVLLDELIYAVRKA